MINRLIPADAFPAGWEAGVGDYLLRHWDDALAPAAAIIEPGLDHLEAEAKARCGTSFTALDAQQQDELLHALGANPESSTGPNMVETEWSVSPALFLQTLAQVAAEGYYSSPEEGGNCGGVSWQMLGYREGPAPDHDPAQFPHPPSIAPAAVNDLEEEYDAVVVGAGAAGGIVACVLAERGHSVLLIERGRWQPYADVGRSHLRNHRLARYGHNTGPDLVGHPRVLVEADGNERVLAPHENGYHNNAMSVGGGTRVYGAQAWRFLPQDFRMASEYGVPDGSALADWPISYADLADAYQRAECEIGVSGCANGAFHASPRAGDFPMPPVPPNPKGERLAAGAAALGWNAAPPPLLINTAEYNGRPACVQCGACVGFACPSESKNGSHNTVIPRALATGRCTLLTQAQVERIETDEHGRVSGVAFFKDVDGQPQRHRVRARAVVASAGAIESARLLLNSGSARHPNGLGNEHDLVGRHLQGHIYPGAFGLFADDIEDNNGPGVSIATCDFNHGNPGIIGGGMLANEFIKLPIIFWYTSLAPDVPLWGAANKEAMRHAFRRTLQVQGPVQEIPDPNARVTLDPRVRDRYGLPVARLSGSVHPESVRTAQFMHNRAVEWLRASGAQRVWSKPITPRLSGGQHQAGTCRMSTDPRTGVTDPWGRVHGHDNLFVVDGSLHVTNGGFNPVLTIMALAYRCADRIADGL